MAKYIPEVTIGNETYLLKDSEARESIEQMDEIDKVLDGRTNELLGFVNYGYDQYFKYVPGSTGATNVTVIRNKTEVYLNGSPTGTYLYFKLNNTPTRSSSTSGLDGWGTPSYFQPWRKYRITVKKISGSCTYNDEPYVPVVQIYKQGTHTSPISTVVYTDGDMTISEFVGNDQPCQVVFLRIIGRVFTDFRCSITMQDLGTVNVVDKIDKKADSIDVEKIVNAPLLAFDDAAADMPMSLTVETGYEQNFNGCEYPWMGGEGKNLFDNEHITIIYKNSRCSGVDVNSTGKGIVVNTSSSGSGTPYAYLDVFEISNNHVGQTYIVSSVYTSQPAYVPCIGIASADGSERSRKDISYTITQDDIGKHMTIAFYGSATSSGTFEYDFVQVEEGSTATEWTPYANICPITGHDRVGITVSDNENGNINVLDSSLIEYGSYTTTGSPSSSDDPAYRRFSVTLQAGTYIVETNIENPYLVRYLVDNNQVASSSTFTPYVITISQESNVKMVYRNTETTQLPDTTEITIKKDYRTYNIFFPNELGTVYGGQITINKDGTGTFVQTWYRHIFDGTESIYGVSSEANRFMRYDLPLTYPKPFSATHSVRNSETKSSHSRIYTITPSTTGKGQGVYYNSSYLYIGIRTNKIVNENQTADELKAYLAEQYANGTPDTIIYRCVPTEPVRLTPQQVRTLLGVGSISCDIGNITSINYPADTKTYIDKPNEAISAIIDTTEYIVAKENHVAGDVFVCDDKLYMATEAIAIGETIEEGTNVTRTITIGSNQVPLTLTNYIEYLMTSINGQGEDITYLKSRATDPDEAMTKTLYIQNGSCSYDYRDVEIKDGVIHFSKTSSSGSAYKSIWITGENMAGGDGTLNGSKPAVGNLVSLDTLSTANQVRVHFNKISGAGYVYICIAYCSVDGDTVTLWGKDSMSSGYDVYDHIMWLSMPEEATHYAIQVYSSTTTTCVIDAYLQFRMVIDDREQ